MTYLNIAAYKFALFSEEILQPLKNDLVRKAKEDGVKGTILLSTEGINLFLAGEAQIIHQWMDDLRQITGLSDLVFKLSESDYIPFKRIVIRIKKEIISLYQPHIEPYKRTAPYLKPEQLKQWYDEHKEMIVLDARNDYEYEIGTFDQAIQLNIEQFSDFPKAIQQLPESAKNKTIVTFCTGGIRCEKAAAYLQEQGFNDVWQLEGGVLNYFEKCKGEYFHGNCFVFDERIALNADLRPIKQ